MPKLTVGSIKHYVTSPDKACRVIRLRGETGIPATGREIPVQLSISVIGHLSYVQIEASLWQQRCQLKGLESIAADFSVAIESGLAVDSLMAAFHIIQKSLG